ncbi:MULTISPECIES: magnesium and cobalt transport protein CorA [Cryobacterium]|uniref:Magnesium and cobalt transport protein CorA n=1 Tax=Cryobacterium breve TaxID=1259258 RepID=A0ABY2IXI6_9MICO|nr:MULTISPECIES: magnesium and cobalt transport protein CorA [Cryobacterium]TFC94452.1 magnesium and cobalt transport protein CorA [Cryobacterium sp. TmT3-12]TFC95056.1 magnesium and cobalt transport protein CorA [Cryobacterium breve]
MALIDNGIYVAGHRAESPHSLEETYQALRENDGMAWIGLYRPDAAEIRSVANEFDLHPLAVEDALTGHQRAKLERYGSTLFLVLRPARYIDETEEVEFGELHLFIGADFVVTVRHAESTALGRVRQRLEANSPLLAKGPQVVLHAILDEVVDEYAPVIAGLENDIDEIENQLFVGDPGVSRRIYDLSREVIEFQRAVHPLIAMLQALLRGSEKYQVELELQRSFRDVLDHAIRVVDRADSFRAILQNALTVHATLVNQRQNDEMRHMSETSLAQNEEVKKISSWAAILFAPALVGTVYGMNFDNMPELHWTFGYPLALGEMVFLGVALYLVFRKKKWL